MRAYELFITRNRHRFLIYTRIYRCFSDMQMRFATSSTDVRFWPIAGAPVGRLPRPLSGEMRTLLYCCRRDPSGLIGVQNELVWKA
jgi:hypothetical protein